MLSFESFLLRLEKSTAFVGADMQCSIHRSESFFHLLLYKMMMAPDMKAVARLIQPLVAAQFYL